MNIPRQKFLIEEDCGTTPDNPNNVASTFGKEPGVVAVIRSRRCVVLANREALRSQAVTDGASGS